jgi:hypothetical protein
MADTILVALAFLHIVSAIAWLGGVAFFLSAVGPGLRSFSQPASLEYLTKVGPRQVRFFAGAATATVVFGFALLLYAFGLSPTAWPVSIEGGMALGFVAYLIAVLVTVPSFRKVEKMARQMMANPQGGPPPAGFALYLRRGNQAAMSVAVILVFATVLMVATAF